MLFLSILSAHLFFFGNPCFYGFFDSSGQVPFFTPKSLDCLEPERLFQFIRDRHAYSTHFNYQPHQFVLFLILIRAIALDVFPISKLTYADRYFHFHNHFSFTLICLFPYTTMDLRAYKGIVLSV